MLEFATVLFAFFFLTRVVYDLLEEFSSQTFFLKAANLDAAI
jgi:hypothetical protein